MAECKSLLLTQMLLMHTRATARALAGLAAVLATLNGCDSPTGADGDSELRPDVRPFVTDSLARGLDARGHFVLPEPEPPGRRPMLDRNQARQVARAYVMTFLRNSNVTTIPGTVGIRETLLEQRQRDIDWDHLDVGDDIWFAEAYLSELPDSLPTFVHNHWGPVYIAPVVDASEQVAVLSVAAYATQVGVREGLLDMPASGGNEFRVAGVPYTRSEGLPVTPEYATRYVAEAVGARVAVEPRMLKANVLWVPLAARWRIELDRSVTMIRRADGSATEVTVLYVSQFPALDDGPPGGPLELRLLAALPDQPVTATVRVNGAELAWPVLPDHPIAFTEVLPGPR